MLKKKIFLETSGNHVHLTHEAVEALFGKGAVLTKKRELSQPGEFLSEQRVRLVTKAGTIDNVAVLGPERSHVQVELSCTDSRKLGIKAPVNLSGDFTNAGDVIIIGNSGFYYAANSVIQARNHIHLRPEDAESLGISGKKRVDVEIVSDRSLIFTNVPLRISERYMPAMHIDYDEANACGWSKDSEAFILIKESEAEMTEGKHEKIAASLDLIADRIVQSLSEEEIRKIRLAAKTEARGFQKESSPVQMESAAVFEDKLVTEKRALELINSNPGKVFVFKKNCIITPSAKDSFKKAHIVLRQGQGD